MDPDANWEMQQRIVANGGSRGDLRELRAALNEWLRNGGFPPRAWGGRRTPPPKGARRHTWTVVFTAAASSHGPRSIGRESLGLTTETKARGKLVSRLRAAMKAEPLVHGAYLQREDD